MYLCVPSRYSPLRYPNTFLADSTEGPYLTRSVSLSPFSSLANPAQQQQSDLLPPPRRPAHLASLPLQPSRRHGPPRTVPRLAPLRADSHRLCRRAGSHCRIGVARGLCGEDEGDVGAFEGVGAGRENCGEDFGGVGEGGGEFLSCFLVDVRTNAHELG